MAERERELHRDRLEKGWGFWKAWVDLKMCPSCKDEAGERSFVDGKLRQYSWYKGDTTVDEALNAMRRFDEIDRALMTIRGVENYGAHTCVNKSTPDIGVKGAQGAAATPNAEMGDKEEGKQEGEEQKESQ